VVPADPLGLEGRELEQAEEARTSNAVAARAGIRIEVIGDLLGKDAFKMNESGP
jgi:hypothetical protein